MFPSDVHELVILLTERKNTPFDRFKRAVTALQILENESIDRVGRKRKASVGWGRVGAPENRRTPTGRKKGQAMS